MLCFVVVLSLVLGGLIYLPMFLRVASVVQLWKYQLSNLHLHRHDIDTVCMCVLWGGGGEEIDPQIYKVMCTIISIN